MSVELENYLQSLTFPDQTAEWTTFCHEFVKKRPFEHQELINGYGIDWYQTGKIWPQGNYKPQRALWLSPHPDDGPFASAVAMRNQVQSGNEVSELIFTYGSAGRDVTGFPDNDEDFGKVRLAESIMAAEIIGIFRVGIITLPGGNRGFKEWFWDADGVNLRPVWISLMRQLNPHLIFSPHPDIEVDTHSDHHAVALVAKQMVSWGPARFYLNQIPGRADDFAEWWRYATWPASKNLPVNQRVEFESEGELSQMKSKALNCFLSQYGQGFGKIAAGYNTYHGGMPSIDSTIEIPHAEVFDVWRPPEVVRVKWQESPTDY